MRRPLRLILPAIVAPACALAGLPPGLLPAGEHRPEVPQPDLGARYTPHPALLAYVRALAAAAPERVKLLTLNVTEEGREQPFLVISSPENLNRLDELQALNAKLADPRTCSEGEARRIAETNPAFVWLGYSVHGSEASGSEAALAVAYHFAAGRSPEVVKQLEHVVILMDLTQNPDGQARHLQAVAEATTPFNTSDPMDAQNTARWPSGRFNHRLFDLNRDWAWQTQGESRAKAAAFLRWNPQVLADHHEMWPEATYYFPPTMQPIHEALPEAFSGRWQAAFGKSVARLFRRPRLGLFQPRRIRSLLPRLWRFLAHLPGRRGHDLRGGRPGWPRLQAPGRRDPHPGRPHPAPCGRQPGHRGRGRGGASGAALGLPAGPPRTRGSGRPRRGLPPGGGG